MDGPLVSECHHANEATIQLLNRCPESYSFSVILHLFSVGVLNHSDTHLFGQLRAPQQHLGLKILSEGNVLGSSFLFRTGIGLHVALFYDMQAYWKLRACIAAPVKSANFRVKTVLRSIQGNCFRAGSQSPPGRRTYGRPTIVWRP